MCFLNTSKSWETFSVGTCSSYNETLRKGGKRRKLWSDLEYSPANHPRQLHIFHCLLFQYQDFKSTGEICAWETRGAGVSNAVFFTFLAFSFFRVAHPSPDR